MLHEHAAIHIDSMSSIFSDGDASGYAYDDGGESSSQGSGQSSSSENAFVVRVERNKGVKDALRNR